MKVLKRKTAHELVSKLNKKHNSDSVMRTTDSNTQDIAPFVMDRVQSE